MDAPITVHGVPRCSTSRRELTLLAEDPQGSHPDELIAWWSSTRAS